jgi:hypothetical protein
VYLIPFLEQQVGEIAAILPCDAGNQRALQSG